MHSLNSCSIVSSFSLRIFLSFPHKSFKASTPNVKVMRKIFINGREITKTVGVNHNTCMRKKNSKNGVWSASMNGYCTVTICAFEFKRQFEERV